MSIRPISYHSAREESGRNLGRLRIKNKIQKRTEGRRNKVYKVKGQESEQVRRDNRQRCYSIGNELRNLTDSTSRSDRIQNSSRKGTREQRGIMKTGRAVDIAREDLEDWQTGRLPRIDLDISGGMVKYLPTQVTSKTS